MSKQTYSRAHHVVVDKVLLALNKKFLKDSKCFFGGGTRIVLELEEYRESADIDLLCSDRAGFRALRATISDASLGEIIARPIKLAREVRADQYGIRTVFRVDDELIKFEIINEARIDLSGEVIESLHVPSLDRQSCFAEKILANADRGSDPSVLSRDVIDLAYMIESWEPASALEGMRRARQAYGDTAEISLKSSAQKLLDDKRYLDRCIDGNRITKTKILMSGLRKLISKNWRR